MTPEFEHRFIAARRAVIARDFERLNDMQTEAVLKTQGPLLVLAGAGSGKTTVLIERIYNILRYGSGSDSSFVPDWVSEEDLDFLEAVASGKEKAEVQDVLDLCAVEPPDPWRVIAITFTNKAAGELKERLTARIGDAADAVWAMTFHSACVRILRRDIEYLGFSRSFTIYDSSDSQSVIKRLMKEMEVDEKKFPPRTVLAEISRAKDTMITAEDYFAGAKASGDIWKTQIGKLYIQYARELRAADALDFDDIILMTVRLLSEYPEVRDYYQRKFQYTLIDEYQDTDHMQYKLASLLSGGTGNLCVVGDDDQSIYKFRGATIRNILDFEEEFPGAQTIRLEQNYRSTGYILDAANGVIENNLGRKGKTLWTSAPRGEKPELHISQNDDDEAQFVATKILNGVSKGGSFSDYAVLYRVNAQANRLEFYLKRNGIPYRVYGGTRFFDRAEIKDMLSYLCVVSNPDDDLRLLRIINNPPRGIGAKTIENLKTCAGERNCSLWELASGNDNVPELKKLRDKLSPFVTLIADMRDKAQTLPPDALYDYVLDKSGYMAMLSAVNNQENRTRAENVRELRSSILAYMKSTTEPSLPGFLAECALYSELDSMDASESCVTVMTIHSAKGLEFEHVFIIGMEDGIFPGQRSIGDNEEMEEERRLCYVALTRAKRRLTMVCANQRMLYGRTSSSLPSRFIDEIPDACLKRTGKSRTSYSSFNDYGDFGSSYKNQKGRKYGSDYDEFFGDRYHDSFNEDSDESGLPSARFGAYSAKSGSSVTPSSRYSSPVVQPSASAKNNNAQSKPSSSAVSDARSAAAAASARKAAAVEAKPQAAPGEAYGVGDTVVHKAFGRGKIIAMRPAPTGDTLIEVEFSSKVRKLMLSAARPYMHKE